MDKEWMKDSLKLHTIKRNNLLMTSNSSETLTLVNKYNTK